MNVEITDSPLLPTPRASPNPEAKRGSYRFLLKPEKRSRANYTGLDEKEKQRQGYAVPLRGGGVLAESPLPTEANAMMNMPGVGTPLSDVDPSRGRNR